MADCEKSSAGDYVWLAYSIFFFVEPLVRNTARSWLINGLVYALFLCFYVGSVRSRRPPRKLAFLAAMALLGLAVLPANAGSSCFLTFSIAFLPFIVESTTVVVACITVESIAVALIGRAAHISWPNCALAIFMMVVVGTSNIFIGQKKRTTARLLLAQDEIERLAALAERERIARDMHDVLGHTLSVIVLKAELARRLLEQPTSAASTQAAAEIADVESTARTALAEVRDAITGYRSEGLRAELDRARRTLGSAGVTLQLNTSLAPSNLSLSATEETVLSLAVREAVTNIVRHAHASACHMRLAVTPDGFHSLLVEDNGAGQAEPREGNGLRGMRERVQALGGRFRIAPGGADLPGTSLLVELPAPARLQQSDL